MSRTHEISRDGRWSDEDSNEATDNPFYDAIHPSRPSSPQAYIHDNKHLVPYHEATHDSSYAFMETQYQYVPEQAPWGELEFPPSRSPASETNGESSEPTDLQILERMENVLRQYLRDIPAKSETGRCLALTAREVAYAIWTYSQELATIPNGELAGVFHSFSRFSSSSWQERRHLN